MGSAHDLAYDIHNGAPFEVTDPGSGVAINVDRYNMTIPLTVAGTETNTLAAPLNANARLRIFCAVRSSGTRTITVASAVNASGHTSIAFDAVDEYVILESFPVGGGVYEWRVVDSAGVTIS